ncbi:rRNA maturation RNAse YbeY [Candidatus Amesbacteria bacterium]|nr:rRNA maturation RNAse YbeY [Candidatus Amesbacteria bacterium]
MTLLEDKKIKDLIEKMVREHGIKGEYEVNVGMADEKEMKELGKKWMHDDELHEVISWPLENTGPDADGVWRLGDVVVWKGAENKDFLVEHGVKHLLGKHHK